MVAQTHTKKEMFSINCTLRNNNYIENVIPATAGGNRMVKEEDQKFVTICLSLSLSYFSSLTENDSEDLPCEQYKDNIQNDIQSTEDVLLSKD